MARYTDSGQATWTFQIAGYVTAMTSDAEGGFYLAGMALSIAGPTAWTDDAFVSRYSSSGTHHWTRLIGTPASDIAGALAIDPAGGVFVGGGTSGALAGPSAGGSDAFLGRVDAGGATSWVRQFGTSQWDVANELALDGAGGVFVVGGTSGQLGLTNPAADDFYLARFGACYADCNFDGQLTVSDFGCFQTQFVLGDSSADCNGDGALSVPDFGCFQTRFVGGCP